MTKEFYSLKEMEEYYDEKTHSYAFKEDDNYIDLVIFNFKLNIKANIIAWDIVTYDDITANDLYVGNIRAWHIKANNIYAGDINAKDIIAGNINAWSIEAENIKAKNISYFTVCFAHQNIECKSIKGRRKNSKHFVLDGTLEVLEDE